MFTSAGNSALFLDPHDTQGMGYLHYLTRKRCHHAHKSAQLLHGQSDSSSGNDTESDSCCNRAITLKTQSRTHSAGPAIDNPSQT
jgi:hypothetical protein